MSVINVFNDSAARLRKNMTRLLGENEGGALSAWLDKSTDSIKGGEISQCCLGLIVESI